MPVRSPKSRDLRGERGDQAVVVERGRAQLAGERAAAPPSPAWRAPGSPAARSAAPGGASQHRRPARRSRIAVSAWLTSSWRSWAMRERSCSWARRTARPASRRSSSRRASMRLKSAVSRWTSRAAPARRARRACRGRRGRPAPSSATSRSSGSSRRRSSSEFSSTALKTREPEQQQALAVGGVARAGRARRPRRRARSRRRAAVLTARTWVRSVRVRIASPSSASRTRWRDRVEYPDGSPALYFLKY